MPSLAIKGIKKELSRKAALKLVKEKKIEGHRAFLEYYPGNKKYQVIWY